MESLNFLDRYPVRTLEIPKRACLYRSLDEIIAFLRERIDLNPIAVYIGLFDHYAHTRSLADGEIAPEIRGVKNLLFCFGQKIPSPVMAALRPRSLAVCETDTAFVLSFLEAPVPAMNETMTGWVEALRKAE